MLGEVESNALKARYAITISFYCIIFQKFCDQRKAQCQMNGIANQNKGSQIRYVIEKLIQRHKKVKTRQNAFLKNSSGEKYLEAMPTKEIS